MLLFALQAARRKEAQQIAANMDAKQSRTGELAQSHQRPSSPDKVTALNILPALQGCQEAWLPCGTNEAS
jgi:hypothetical protein